MNKKNDEKKDGKTPLNESANWLYCDKHNVQYPKGAKCPLCSLEAKGK